MLKCLLRDCLEWVSVNSPESHSPDLLWFVRLFFLGICLPPDCLTLPEFNSDSHFSHSKPPGLSIPMALNTICHLWFQDLYLCCKPVFWEFAGVYACLLDILRISCYMPQSKYLSLLLPLPPSPAHFLILLFCEWRVPIIIPTSILQPRTWISFFSISHLP